MTLRLVTLGIRILQTGPDSLYNTELARRRGRFLSHHPPPRLKRGVYQQAFAEGKLKGFGGNTIVVERSDQPRRRLRPRVRQKRVKIHIGEGVVYGVGVYMPRQV